MSNLYTDMGIEGDTLTYLRTVHPTTGTETQDTGAPNVEVGGGVPTAPDDETKVS